MYTHILSQHTRNGRAWQNINLAWANARSWIGIYASLGDGYLVMDGYNAAQYHVVLKVTDFTYHIRA